ncbi:MAG: pentapeptide repeat-containing protein [Pseudomonadota bacterium]
MSVQTITSKNNNDILFEGVFESFTACMEAAICENVDLSHADLRHKNLALANLDDARIKYADFTGSNLNGANLSEADLSGSIFSNANLYNTCFAYSDLQHCHFAYSNFGATDIAASTLSFSIFSGLSCFSLNFFDAKAMQDCIFNGPNGETMRTSEPPIVIKGLKSTPIILMSKQIKPQDSRPLVEYF